jgi:hypothetical protein
MSRGADHRFTHLTRGSLQLLKPNDPSCMRIQYPQRCDAFFVIRTRVPKLAERDNCNVTESSRRVISKDALQTHAGLMPAGLCVGAYSSRMLSGCLHGVWPFTGYKHHHPFESTQMTLKSKNAPTKSQLSCATICPCTRNVPGVTCAIRQNIEGPAFVVVSTRSSAALASQS